MTRRILSLAPLLVLVACRQPAPHEPMPRETFIHVMVELRRAAQESPSQAEFEARKEAILAEAGVSDSALVAFVRAHEGRLDYLSALWDSVDARLRAGPDTI